MSIADIIQLGILLTAILTICVTLHKNSRQRKLQMFAEYTRRYQEIFLNMPDDIYDGTAKVNTATTRFLRLYFDLCSEEYHLWKDKDIPENVWSLWLEGMQIACQHELYKNMWQELKKDYNLDFRSYFEDNVINNVD